MTQFTAVRAALFSVAVVLVAAAVAFPSAPGVLV